MRVGSGDKEDLWRLLVADGASAGLYWDQGILKQVQNSIGINMLNATEKKEKL